ncbi:MAG: hypothetical protein EOM20_12350 [Spartobacteria bacterium]|nr:hypothetical protein [Spartobacteria bacterium]
MSGCRQINWVGCARVIAAGVLGMVCLAAGCRRACPVADAPIPPPDRWGRGMEQALANDVRFLQIATWNDFGEGATIEPAVEYGYRYLELTEAYAARLKGLPSDRGAALAFPLELYQAEKALEMMPSAQADSPHPYDLSAIQRQIDQAAACFAAGRVEEAATTLEAARALMGR